VDILRRSRHCLCVVRFNFLLVEQACQRSGVEWTESIVLLLLLSDKVNCLRDRRDGQCLVEVLHTWGCVPCGGLICYITANDVAIDCKTDRRVC